MDITVIICTYNRSASLRQTLTTLGTVEIPPGLVWEVLVVDNNSRDDTRQVCESFAARLPIRYVFEPRQGVNCARNRGVIEAGAPLILFTDDDVNIDRQWIAAYWRAARRYPDMGYFGGRIYPLWECTPPAWLSKHSRSMLRPVAVHLDLGDEERVLTDRQPVLWSGNVAFRRALFTDSVRFCEDIGRKGQDEVRCGETELMQRLLQRGARRVYVPSAIVHHRNPSHRATERYVFAHYKGAGITEVRYKRLSATSPTWGGAPRQYWGKLIRNGLKYAVTRWTRPSEIWLRALIEAGRSWGIITELRRIKMRPAVGPSVIPANQQITELSAALSGK